MEFIKIFATSVVGVRNFLDPQEYKQPVLTQSKPYNLHWGVRASVNVKHIAAGYGFSLLAAENKGILSLFGFGMNTDSQIGFHSEQGRLIFIYLSPCLQ